MEFKLEQALGNVRFNLIDTLEKSNKRRLISFDNYEIKCKSGCSGCCKRLIKLTMAEAFIIYEYLKSNDLWDKVKIKAEDQLPTIKNSNDVTWFMMNKPCPVLNKHNNCLAYKVRPILCSTHFVKSDPILCDPLNMDVGKYESIQFNDFVEDFLKKLLKNTALSGIFQLELSLQESILLAEKINLQVGLDLDQIISLFFNEL